MVLTDGMLRHDLLPVFRFGFEVEGSIVFGLPVIVYS